MTIEQYGSGRYVVALFYDGYRGTFRFPTRLEAEAFRKSQRGYNPPRRTRLTLSARDDFSCDLASTPHAI